MSQSVEQMQATYFERHGGIDVLTYGMAPKPKLKPGEALVKVSACGVNRLDILVRTGTVPGPISLPHISGSEIAGIVEQLIPKQIQAADVRWGDDSRVADYGTIRVGTRVVVAPYLCCDACENCRKGEETTCLHSDIIGLRSQGGYAEYVAVPISSLVPIPDSVSFEAGAAVALAALTAYHMVVTKAKVQRGETVLILSAGSGVGNAAIQLCRWIGARIITTIGSEEKRDAALQLGADEVIHHRSQSIADTVRALTSKRGVDVVVEHVGEATWEASVRCLARNGRLVTCGALTGSTGSVDIWTLFAKQLQLIGAYGGTRQELYRLLDLVATNQFNPVIARRFTRREIPVAHAEMERNRHFGKLIIVNDA